MRINEIFLSVQGEGVDAGLLCTFIRLTGCNLRCTYCDTEYAFHEGADRSIDDLLAASRELAAPMVCVTGGEPVLQKDVVPLMAALLAAGYHVLLETGGSLPLDRVPAGVVKVMDIKTPGALAGPDAPPDFASSPGFVGEHLHYPNLDLLGPRDQVKLVLTGRADYEWALAFLDEHRVPERVGPGHVLLSPAFGELDPRELIAWMSADKPPARLNLQLHKYIWSPETRGV